MGDVDKIQGFYLNFASWLKRTILERDIVVMTWMWKGLSFIWFRGWLRWERFVWLMISLLSVISHYNRCRVSRDVMVRVVSSIRQLMLGTWIIFLHLERVGFLYINGGHRMTWFQFYFKIFVLDIFLLILHSEERGRKWNWEGVLKKGNSTCINYFIIILQIVIVGNFSLAFI